MSFEVKTVFYKMVRNWFDSVAANYNDFMKALLLNNVEALDGYMNWVAVGMLSQFDMRNKPSKP